MSNLPNSVQEELRRDIFGSGPQVLTTVRRLGSGHLEIRIVVPDTILMSSFNQKSMLTVNSSCSMNTPNATLSPPHLTPWQMVNTTTPEKEVLVLDQQRPYYLSRETEILKRSILSPGNSLRLGSLSSNSSQNTEPPLRRTHRYLLPPLQEIPVYSRPQEIQLPDSPEKPMCSFLNNNYFRYK